jgi:hypothetical protein
MGGTRWWLVLSALAFGLGGSGCTASAPRLMERREPYIDSEYAPYRATGTAEILGTAVARARDGSPVYGAEDSVYLFPATPYSEEWWRRTMLEGAYLPPPDPRSLALMRTTVADGRGRFRFRSLPAGAYYVVCIVTWREDEDQPLQIANLGKRVVLHAGEAADAPLLIISRHRALVDPPPAPSDDR